jgi:ceramide glucosyltransferase
MISWLILGLGVLGTVSSTVFLGLTLLGVRKFHEQARRDREEVARASTDKLPLVSILKPLHGLEPQLRQNLESFFRQDYPEYEVLFAVDSADDPALPVARSVCDAYPQIQSRILVTGRGPWPNRPVYSFAKMAEIARASILVTSDSDVLVGPGYLRAVVVPLLGNPRKTGMLTCVYRGVSAGGFWTLLDAVGMSVEMTAGVLVANLLEGMKFGLGPTIVVHREALEAIGGYPVLGEYGPNDFVIGNMIAERGYRVVLSSHVISHVAPPMTLRQMLQRHLRWAIGTRYSRPKGHFGSGLVYAVPFGIFGLIGGLLLHRPALGLGLLSWSILNRIIEALVVGWGVTRDIECLRKPWVYPIRDLLGFCVWVASYLGRGFRWRSGDYEFAEGGRMVVRGSRI